MRIQALLIAMLLAVQVDSAQKTCPRKGLLSRNTCRDACKSLTARQLLVYTGDHASSKLWSNFQAEVRPACRVVPNTSQEVAAILEVLVFHQCEFAVLGGGTSPFKGVSNSDDGVTIDLQRLRQLEVHTAGIDSPLLTAGAGILWADVYTTLDRYGMSATGTRNSLTGVVGSILGGGISFFSEFHGWACDTVVEFEIVLANSSIVTANEKQHNDLFWALKGGGNNFGIVTQVKLEAFYEPPNWYTFQRFDILDQKLVFDRLYQHISRMPSGVWQIAVTLQWHVPTQRFVITDRMVASKLPTLPEYLVETHDNGTFVKRKVLDTSFYQRSILEMAQKMDDMNEYGYYNLFGSVTVQSNAQMFEVIAELFKLQVASIQSAEGLKVYMVYNPLTVNTLRKMGKHGGNALGLRSSDGPLTIVNINLHWSQSRDHERMRSFMRSLIQEIRKAALERGLHHAYLFQNHAFEEQDVFSGYGVANLRKLQAIRGDVDPDGVFQYLQPGYFKLDR